MLTVLNIHLVKKKKKMFPLKQKAAATERERKWIHTVGETKPWKASNESSAGDSAWFGLMVIFHFYVELTTRH